MSEPWERLVAEWSGAGVIDTDTAQRIRAFESGRAGGARWRWPLWLALAFGGIMLGAGVLLFVAAHWDELSPFMRFATVLASVAVFHAAGALSSPRQPALATVLHAVGTVAVGGGIYVSGQIFNLAEHWPGGLMLWALGAAIGALLLQSWPQVVLVAGLVPTWLASEWMVAVGLDYTTGARVLALGVLLVAITYFSAATRAPATATRRALVWIGGLTLPPAALSFALATQVPRVEAQVPAALTALGWSVAIAGPLVLAVVLRREASWPNAVSAVWAVGLMAIQTGAVSIAEYGWWAIGAVGLVAWGLRDLRTERINMGAAIFSATVIAFYFSEVMSRLGRSASLIGLGLVFLAGGWAIERARRHLVRQATEGAS